MQCHHLTYKLYATKVFHIQEGFCSVRILWEGRHIFCNSMNSNTAFMNIVQCPFSFVFSDPSYLKISSTLPSVVSFHLHSALFFLKDWGSSSSLGTMKLSNLVQMLTWHSLFLRFCDTILNINGMGLDQQGQIPVV